MHYQTMLPVRGPIRVVADSLAEAIRRSLNRIAPPKDDSLLRFAAVALPDVIRLVQSLRPQAPVDLDGHKVKQVRREFAAEDARFSAEHAEKRARLVAEFGPRFDDAHVADDVRAKAAEPDAEGDSLMADLAQIGECAKVVASVMAQAAGEAIQAAE